MTAQPISDGPGPDDPAQILRSLPAEYHAAFLSEYKQALQNARRPEQYRELTALLRFWRLRALAYSDPGYPERLAAAKAGETVGDVPLEQLVPGWPPEQRPSFTISPNKRETPWCPA
jgi:hypothetical protein